MPNNEQARTTLYGVLAFALAGCSAEQPDTPESRMIEARQSNFRVMKEANDAMKKEAESADPKRAVFQESASTLSERVARIHEGFPEGTGPEAGVDTEALPAIWQRRPEFVAATNKMKRVLQQFSETAAQGDVQAIRAGVETVGAACRECHQQFRQQS